MGAEPAYFAALHPEAVRSACHDYMDNVVHVGDVNIVTDKYRCGVVWGGRRWWGGEVEWGGAGKGGAEDRCAMGGGQGRGKNTSMT